MDAPSFKAVVANGFVHLTIHNPDHPDQTIRMLAAGLPHLLEALAAVAEVPDAEAKTAKAAPADDHAHEEHPPHEDVKPAAAAEDPPASDHPAAS